MTGQKPSADTPFPTLFSPIRIGGLELRNRLAHAAIQTKFPEDGQASERLIAYHRARAEGGAGLIVTEPMAMTSVNRETFRLRAWDDAAADSLARLAAAVESADTRLIGQVQDAGRGRHAVGRNEGAVGASALPDDLSWTVPRVLEPAGIRQLVDEWAAASRRLRRAGFSGVEISAGHGHIFHQFLSPASNRRDDEYGGSLENRARLVADLVAAIRSACDKPFVIGLKLPGEDGIAGGIDADEARRIAGYLAEAVDIDYWTFAWGAHGNSLWRHLPDAHGPRHPYLDAIRRLRDVAPGIPTGALGYFTDPHECEAALAGGDADLVFLGRSLIADPAFGTKAAAGRAGSIRYCVSGNNCWRSLIESGMLACDNNPRVGEANEQRRIERAASPGKRVVVVGSGVAGLEAAATAALRGHDVTLFGASPAVGGKTRLHGALPGGENLSSIYDYQLLAGREAGVRYELDRRAGAADVLALDPDLVLLATGARLTVPPFVPAELRDYVPDLRSFARALLSRTARDDGHVVIYDHDHTGMTYAVAELAAARFRKITIVTPRERIAADVSLVARQGIYHRLSRAAVGLVTSVDIADLDGIGDGNITLANVWSGERSQLADVTALAYATPRVPTTELHAPLAAAGLKVMPIGDCRAPRTVMASTREGYEVAMQL